MLVLEADELLSVAGGQEQCVVGPGAEHEHEQDPAGLAVDHDARLGQKRSEAAHDRLGEEDPSSGISQKTGLR